MHIVHASLCTTSHAVVHLPSAVDRLLSNRAECTAFGGTSIDHTTCCGMVDDDGSTVQHILRCQITTMGCSGSKRKFRHVSAAQRITTSPRCHYPQPPSCLPSFAQRQTWSHSNTFIVLALQFLFEWQFPHNYTAAFLQIAFAQ